MTRPNDPKDQNNFMLAIVLSLAVLLGWQYFFANPQIEKERQRQEYAKKVEADRAANANNPANGAAPSVASPNGSPVATPSGTTPGAGAPVAAVEAARQSIPRDQALAATPRVTVETPSLKGSIALKSGRIDDLTLIKYHETVDPKSPNVTLFSPANAPEPYFAEYGWVSPSGSNIKIPDRDTVWTLESGDKLTPSTPITLAYDNGEGLIFRRTISIDEDYMFKVINDIENKTQSDVTLLPYARVHRYGQPENVAFYILHEGLIGVSGEEGLQEITYASATDNARPVTYENVTGGWLGITDKYWAATLIPDQKTTYRAMYSAVKGRLPGEKNAFQADYLREAITVPPAARKGVESHLFAGAKQATKIDAYQEQLDITLFDRLIDWGWFYFITKPLFWLLEKIYSFVGNFGVAILVLTVFVKAVFYPLANKQYESMARMKKMQPEMQRLKEVYKDDPQRQQKEMFELYRKEKINPLAGCWPILLQIPVFFALYKVLFVTIDMRHAPFFGWIQDLSAPDPTSLFNLFGLLPFGVPEFLQIGIWPLLMGLTMWVQMQLNPPQPDPVQQQIFNWMPVLFTFLLATFPAGLVIYWTWSNLLSIIQQWYINKKNGAETHLLHNLKRHLSPILRLVGISTSEEAVATAGNGNGSGSGAQSNANANGSANDAKTRNVSEGDLAVTPESRAEALTILGLGTSATSKQINDAFNRLFKRLTPEQKGGDGSAEGNLRLAKDLALGTANKPRN